MKYFGTWRSQLLSIRVSCCMFSLIFLNYYYSYYYYYKSTELKLHYHIKDVAGTLYKIKKKKKRKMCVKRRLFSY